jgi:gliding motility-associated-like protein
LEQFESPYPLRIILNNNGEGTAQYGGLQSECDTTDNDCHVDGRPCTITLPNVITPNGDGFNDVFLPKLEGDFQSMRMEIYDRWGRQVYRQESHESLSWDAEGVSDGVYYCAIDFWCAVSSSKRQRINTSVTVVR